MTTEKWQFEFQSRLDDFEERLARLPAVAHCAIPVLLELGRLADDDVEAVVLHIQGLGGPLDTVLLDPPRTGLGAELCARLRTSGAVENAMA